jgi:hypothetical protein
MLLQDISVDVIDKADQRDQILKPTTLRLHARYSKIRGQQVSPPLPPPPPHTTLLPSLLLSLLSACTAHSP